MSGETISSRAGFLWTVADLLRGDFKQHEYGSVILPFVLIRRLDCLLEPTKDEVLRTAGFLSEATDPEARDVILTSAAGGAVYNTSRFTLGLLRHQAATDLRANVLDYVAGFSPNVRDVLLDRFKLPEVLRKLDDAGSLFMVLDRFATAPLHPSEVSNLEMGYIFEELIRRFSEASNETAGEHFTPREVVRLMVDLVVARDPAALAGRGIIRQVYDPTCGTGGILSIAEDRLRAMNPGILVDLFGQERNGESFAICRSDMLVKGQEVDRIAFGNTLTDDAWKGKRFHYMLANPPYGTEWKKEQARVKAEHEGQGHAGRFGAGLPRVSDGQLLFLQHMISKMRDDEQGSRIGIVMNGSPLFTGGAGSGESEIRRWILDNDWLEAIVALPTSLFYNTGIQTYVWLLTNRKEPRRRGLVQLIDASGERFWRPMRKSLGDKRREIPPEAIAEILRLHELFDGGSGADAEVSKVLPREAFKFREVRVERPLRLRFDITDEALSAFMDDSLFQGMSIAERHEMKKRIRAVMAPHEPITDRDVFIEAFKGVLEAGPEKRPGRRTGSTDPAEMVENIQRNLASLPGLSEIFAALFGKTTKRNAILRRAVEIFGARDEAAEECRDGRGDREPDPELRDHELVPWGETDEAWLDYMDREVKPFVPDAWVDESYRDAKDGKVGRVGTEINVNRHFYRYVPPRPLEEIDAELRRLEAEIAGLLREVAA